MDCGLGDYKGLWGVAAWVLRAGTSGSGKEENKVRCRSASARGCTRDCVQSDRGRGREVLERDFRGVGNAVSTVEPLH